MQHKHEEYVTMQQAYSILETKNKLLKEREFLLQDTIRKQKNEAKEYNKEINRLKSKMDQLEAFRIAMIDQSLNRMSEHEDLMVNARSQGKQYNKITSLEKMQDPMMTFAGASCDQDLKIVKINQSFKTSELFGDFEPVPGFLRAITNEVVDLYDQSDSDGRYEDSNKIGCNMKSAILIQQIHPKIAHSPEFYSSETENINNTNGTTN